MQNTLYISIGIYLIKIIYSLNGLAAIFYLIRQNVKGFNLMIHKEDLTPEEQDRIRRGLKRLVLELRMNQWKKPAYNQWKQIYDEEEMLQALKNLEEQRNK